MNMLIGDLVTNQRSSLIAPPTDDTARYPFRPVWSSLILEAVLMVTAVSLINLASVLFEIPERRWYILNLAIVLVPLMLWSIFSWYRENLVDEPRQRQLLVLVVSAIVANGIGYPLMTNWLAITTWLTRAEATEQILVYILGYGVIQEVLKYMVLRHSVWQNHIRTRYDAVAYANTGAIAYATVFNLHFALSNPAPPNIAAITVLSTLTLHQAGSLMVAYGLAETRLSNPSPFLMVGIVSISAVVTGILNTLINSLTNTRLGFGVSEPRFLLETLLLVAILVAIVVSVAFIIRNADQAEAQLAETT